MSHHSRNGFLCSKGLEEAAQRELVFEEDVDMGKILRYIDSTSSVSALVEGEQITMFDEEILDEQYRRFLPEVEV